jgi:protein-S-isoprenylcysteine O-methyltransferase Ste14
VEVAADVVLVCWAAFELGLRISEAVRGRGRRERDRGTRLWITGSLGVGLAVAAAMPARSSPAGVVVMALGLAVRVWAVVALGRAFRTTVEVDADQAVVTTGPYRWIRHPAYVGLVLVVSGFGLTRGWLAFAIGLLLPLPAIVWRIHVEEAELVRVLGEPYRAYQARTARLLPGVW